MTDEQKTKEAEGKKIVEERLKPSLIRRRAAKVVKEEKPPEAEAKEEKKEAAEAPTPPTAEAQVPTAPKKETGPEAEKPLYSF